MQFVELFNHPLLTSSDIKCILLFQLIWSAEGCVVVFLLYLFFLVSVWMLCSNQILNCVLHHSNISSKKQKNFSNMSVLLSYEVLHHPACWIIFNISCFSWVKSARTHEKMMPCYESFCLLLIVSVLRNIFFFSLFFMYLFISLLTLTCEHKMHDFIFFYQPTLKASIICLHVFNVF